MVNKGELEKLIKEIHKFFEQGHQQVLAFHKLVESIPEELNDCIGSIDYLIESAANRVKDNYFLTDLKIKIQKLLDRIRDDGTIEPLPHVEKGPPITPEELTKALCNVPDLTPPNYRHHWYGLIPKRFEKK